VPLPQLRIETVDPADAVAFARYYGVFAASKSNDRPDTFTPPGLAAERQDALHPTDEIRNVLFLALDADTPVAAGELHRSVTANRHLADMQLHVHPAHRRRGYGSALLPHLEAAAAAAGCTAYRVETALAPQAVVADSPQYAFAARHGYRLAAREQRRQLDLPAAADLGALAAGAAAHHPGYQVVTFRNAVPEEYLAGFALLMSLIEVESPTGDVVYEACDPDPALTRQREAQRRALGQSDYGALAVSPDGEVAAATRMMQESGDLAKISQGGTLVHRDHRGRRLGLAVKVANLRQLGPSYKSVTTWNATDNAPMIAINDLLGFRVIEQGACYQKLR
jgi:GNAT superfamily N-acetyltransferase